MIKILHIITGLSTGGAETMLLKLLTCLDREHYSPVVVSLTDTGTIGSKIEALGIPVYPLKMSRGVPSPLGMIKLARILWKESPAIIQGWMYHGNIAAQLASLFVKNTTPIIWNIRCSYTKFSDAPPLTAFIIWLGAQLSGLPAYIVNNSRTSAVSHQQLGYLADKWRIIPNGFDQNVFTPSNAARTELRSELKLAPDSLLIGLVGRYHPVKDHAGFLNAASFLLKRYPDVHFVLIGEGVTVENLALSALLQEARLQKAVHLLGNRSDLPSLTAGFDIATSCSRAEGFSNVVGEAMSCAVPCVVTNVGDSAWIVGQTGRVIPSGNPEALADAWAELIVMGADARRSLGTMARQRIIDNFSLESVSGEYMALYEEVLPRKGKVS